MTKAIIEKEEYSHPSGAEVTIDKSPTIEEMVAIETHKREVLTKYIKEHMKEGVDFGKIGNFPKDCLFKPGSEKFLSLMSLTVKFEKDTDTFEMAGSTPGLFCYKAVLINKLGEVIGEGRGACSIQEKKNPNVAIKIALKRAQMDAVLRTGGLSDFFTQDLDDLPQSEQKIDADKIKPFAKGAVNDYGDANAMAFNNAMAEVKSEKTNKQIAVDKIKEEGFGVDVTEGLTCSECGNGKMQLKEGTSKAGRDYKFYGCTNYPNCNNTKQAN